MCICVFVLSKCSEEIRAKVLKYFKTCKVRLNTLSWYLLLWTWTDMYCWVKSQALLKQILMKACLNTTRSWHSSSEVIVMKKKKRSLTDFSSDGFQYVGEGPSASNLLSTGRGMKDNWWILLFANRFTSAHLMAALLGSVCVERMHKRKTNTGGVWKATQSMHPV